MNIIDQNLNDTGNNEVLDPGRDAIPALSSKAMFWRPKYLAESLWLEHIPFYFWLVEAQQSSLILEPELTSGSTYFAMCQAVEKLNFDTRCVGVLNSINKKYEEAVGDYNNENYREFSFLVDEPLKDCIHDFEDESIDIMILKYSSELLFNKKLMDAWQKKLSKKSIVLIQGSQKKGAKHLCRNLKKTYSTFEFVHGNGLLLVCFGEKPSEKIKFLVSRGVNDSSTRVIQDIYSRLGVACKDAYINKVNDRKVNELNEILLEKSKRLEASNEIEKQNFDLSESIGKRFNEIASLTNLLVETEKDRDKIQSELIEKKKANDMISSRLKGLEKTLEVEKKDKFNSISKVSEKLNAIELELDEAKNTLDENKKKTSILIRNNELLEKDQASASNLISDLKKNNAALKESVDKRFHELSVLTKILQEKDKQIQQLSNIKMKGEGKKNSLSRFSAKGLKNKYKQKKKAKTKLNKRIKLLLGSDLFDRDWYMSKYPESRRYKAGPEAHYINVGADKGFNPSNKFSTGWYMNMYPDVAEVGVNPLIHYIEYGQKEGRLLS